MAFQDLVSELRGAVPKIPISFCGTLINRAWREIRESMLWSFNIVEHSWISPTPLTAGSVTVTQGSATVFFDTVVAVPAILAGSTSFSLITQRQFRQQASGGIYNILALDNNFAANGAAYLDRIFGDPSSTNSSYQIYQLYYTPPFQDYLTLISVRNPTMYLNLDLTKPKEWIDARDPQRSWYQFPTHVVPWGRDLRQGQVTFQDNSVHQITSSTFNFPLFELWGQPVTFFTYQVYGLRRGTNLVNPSDVLPPPVGDDLVLAKAYYYAYQWAEANKDQQPRSQGPDFRFLMGSKKDEYKDLLRLYRKQDKETVNNYFHQRDPDITAHAYGYYNTLAKTAGPYTQL